MQIILRDDMEHLGKVAVSKKTIQPRLYGRFVSCHLMMLSWIE